MAWSEKPLVLFAIMVTLFMFVMPTHHGILICRFQTLLICLNWLTLFKLIFIYSVKNCAGQVSVLEWDQSGNNLLIGDAAGNAEMWTTLTHLLNEWTKVAHITLPDEPIKAGIFFCNGKRVTKLIICLYIFGNLCNCVTCFEF